MQITKAIIAAAGFGTRFLPATKVIPKELLPLIDRPIIQYLVEEAVESGIKEIILVIRPGVPLIKNHFNPKTSLARYLSKQGNGHLLNSLKRIGQKAKIIFVEQNPKLPYGTGAPLLSAKNQISKGEFFALMFGDDLVKAKVPATKQLIKLWQKNKKAIILGCQEVPKSEVNRYGIIKLKKGTWDELDDLVEKPKPKEAPSRLASFGRFILNREIIDILLKQCDRVTGDKEFYLVDAISEYARENKVLAKKIDGQWLTTGDPLNWLKANLEFALEKKGIKEEFTYYLKTLKLR